MPDSAAEPLFPDIVERLRLGTKFRQSADVDALMDEAADEIERLRKELEAATFTPYLYGRW